MRKYLIALFLVTSAQAGLNAQRFEGKLVMKGMESETATFFIKGDKVRLEMKSEDGPLALLYGAKDPKVVALMPERRYAEIPVMMLGEDGLDKGSETLSRTAEKRTIHGLVCEKWVVVEKGLTTVIWMTKDLGVSWADLIAPVARVAMPKWKDDRNDYFPMEVTQMKKGKTEKIIEITSLERMALADDKFTIPSGFQQMGN
jgi:hypothetical protein